MRAPRITTALKDNQHDVSSSEASSTETVTASMDGRIVRGSYAVGGRKLVVISDYGSASAETGGLPDSDLAVMMLRDILKTWRMSKTYSPKTDP